jgi:hypothetical protein
MEAHTFRKMQREGKRWIEAVCEVLAKKWAEDDQIAVELNEQDGHRVRAELNAATITLKEALDRWSTLAVDLATPEGQAAVKQEKLRRATEKLRCRLAK